MTGGQNQPPFQHESPGEILQSEQVAGLPSFPVVDALFGSRPEAGVRSHGLRKMILLLALATPLDILGIVGCTNIPGVFLTLWVWSLLKKESSRPIDDPRQQRLLVGLKLLTTILLVVCAVSLPVQFLLHYNGFYERLLSQLLEHSL